MYFDPLEFPLLDESLIPPLPKDQPPQDENVAAEGPVEGQVEAEPSGDGPTQSGDAQAGDNQEPHDDRSVEAANDYEPESEEAAPVETYDALCDPSLPIYLPRTSRGEVDFSHHRRKCLVCRHAYRAVIEHDYLSWRDPDDIARDCGFRDARPILRHAQATGLERHRASRITSALERLIYKASSATPSAGSIVSAIKLYAQMTGSWTPPPRQVVVTHVRHGVPYGARKDASSSAPDDASRDVRESVRDDARPSARDRASGSAPADARSSVSKVVNHSVPDGLRDGERHGVAYGARVDASNIAPADVRDGVSHDLRDEVRQEWRDEVPHEAPAVAHPDSATASVSSTEAAASPEVTTPTEAAAATVEAVSHPIISGGPRLSPAHLRGEAGPSPTKGLGGPGPLPAPAAPISNQLLPRLESDLSP